MRAEQRLATARPYSASDAARLRGVRPLELSERRFLLLAFDLIAVTGALAIVLGGQRAASLDDAGHAPLLWLLFLWFIWGISASVFDVYNLRVAARARISVLRAYQAILAAFLLYAAIPYLAPPLVESRLLLSASLLFAFVAAGAGRLAYARLFTQPQFLRRSVIVGSGAIAQEAAELLKRNAHTEYVAVGLIPIAPSPDVRLPVLGQPSDLLEIVRTKQISEVILAAEADALAEIAAFVVDLYKAGVEVVHVSDLYEEITGRIAVRAIGSHWLAALPQRPGGGRPYDLAVRAIDVAVSAVALVVLSPFFLLIALAVRADSSGPALYTQTRAGRFGRPFRLVKFRSMVQSAEEGAPRWASPADPRRTRIGRLLRPTRLDELPQLWNVLMGDMSLIGPRPERPEFIEDLEREIPFYRARLLVRPGLTGWAQVRSDYASSASESLEKLQYDLYYVKHRSPYLDLVIAIKTVGVVLRASGR